MKTSTSRGNRRVGRPPGPSPDPATRREDLLDAAERVIRAQGPDVGMSDIAADIGLTKPAVYRSLGGKAELSAALAQRVGARLGTQLAAALAGPGELHDVISGAIDVFCTFVDEDTNLYRFIVHGSKGTGHTGLQDKPLVGRLAQEIGVALAVALQTADQDPEIAETWSYAILGAVFVATEHWRHTRHIPREKFVDQLTRLVTPALEQQGLRPPPP